jgi:hypothetical protein
LQDLCSASHTPSCSSSFSVSRILTSVADRNDTQKDALLGNAPLWFGEFALSTEFNATDGFLYKWADAQKFKYSQSNGWLVCSSPLLQLPFSPKSNELI